MRSHLQYGMVWYGMVWYAAVLCGGVLYLINLNHFICEFYVR